MASSQPGAPWVGGPRQAQRPHLYNGVTDDGAFLLGPLRVWQERDHRRIRRRIRCLCSQRARDQCGPL